MYWNSTNDNTLDISDAGYYQRFEHMKATIGEGYRCDPLSKTPVLFLGSCDMSGPLDVADQVWSRKVHASLQKVLGEFPYIGLSRVHTGYAALVRRLYTFCETYGPPRRLFVVLPRPVCMEIPIRGTLVNVTERERYVKFLYKVNKLTESEFNLCMQAVEFARSHQDNPDYQLYQFEQSSAFLKTLCQAHKIKLQWTPNLSATAVDYYARWIELFLKDNQFMRERCVGVAPVKDFASDGSTGLLTQDSIAETMLSSMRPSLNTLKAQAEANLAFLKSDVKLYEKITTDAKRAV